MINTIFSDISRIFDVVWNWVTQINEKVPFLTIALGIFLVYSLSRFFIMPLLKDGLKASSDSVKKDRGKKE